MLYIINYSNYIKVVKIADIYNPISNNELFYQLIEVKYLFDILVKCYTYHSC